MRKKFFFDLSSHHPIFLL